MSIFDLLFLLAVLASLVTFVVAAVSAVRSRRGRALRILRVYGGCVVLYLAVGLAVGLLKPQRVLSIGDPWCFDDWCLAVDAVDRTQGQVDNTYRVDFRIFSQAGRPQRAKGAWIYLVDDYGQRVSPDPDASAVPLDVLLQPRDSLKTSRVFHVPARVQHLGLITGHGGPYCGSMSFLVIGESGCLFRKPTMIRIQ